MIKQKKAPKYFTIPELCRSTTATRHGIENTPSRTTMERMVTLIIELLDPIRELWGGAIYVNSGFRGATLNRFVGGVASSQHTRGEAADLTTGNVSGNRELFEMVENSGLEFDQLIDEQNYSWIHISYSERNRNQVLHL